MARQPLNPIQASSLLKFKVNKFKSSLDHILPDEITVSDAEAARVAEAIGIGHKAQANGCLRSAAVSALLLVAAVIGLAVAL